MLIFRNSLPICVALFCGFTPTLSSAHELWIEPERWRFEKGDEIRADLLNGENFSGSKLAWIHNNVSRADVAFGPIQFQVSGRMGDRPALVTEAQQDGLAIVIHETTPSRISYKTWEKFQKFVDHKDLGITRTDHEAKGHPPEGFTESYTRHTKSLIAIGDGAGVDRAFGLQTEIVALTNPFADGFNNDMQIQLLYQGRARLNTQVEIFERAPDETVSVSTVKTDNAGIARIPVKSGHTYLFDAVVIRPGSQGNAIYDTLWAGLSFHVPNNVPD
ncbi:MAG: DUF4198 domain-containing protein [Paracoccaceae bacterium]